MERRNTALVLRFFRYTGITNIDLSPALALIQSKLLGPKKIGWFYRCLYPFFAVQIENKTGKMISLYDAYLPLTQGYTVPKTENLSEINNGINSYAETINVDRLLNILKTIKKYSGDEDGQRILGVVDGNCARSILSFFEHCSTENIAWSVVLKPSISEEDVLKDIQRLLALENEMHILDNLISMFETLNSEIIDSYQNQIDENFHNLDEWKNQRIDGMMHRRRECEEAVRRNSDDLSELNAELLENQRVITEIDGEINNAQTGRESADSSGRLRIDLRLSEYKRNRNVALLKRNQIEEKISSIQSAVNKNRDAIRSFDREIQKIRDTLPHELRTNANDFERMKVLAEEVHQNLRHLQSTQNDAHSSLLSLSAEGLSCGKMKEFSVGDCTISLTLFYLPLYFIKKQRFLGLQQSYYFLVPCSIPASVSSLAEKTLARYFQQVLFRIPKSDLKHLKRLGKTHNDLKKPKIIDDIKKGIHDIQSLSLLAGLEEKLIRKLVR
jgi:hypothetical protein